MGKNRRGDEDTIEERVQKTGEGACLCPLSYLPLPCPAYRTISGIPDSSCPGCSHNIKESHLITPGMSVALLQAGKNI
jgi:hypothetical protein